MKRPPSTDSAAVRLPISLVAFTAVVGLAVAVGVGGSRAAPATDAMAALQTEFSTHIWPLLDRAEGGCVACHGESNPSQLKFGPGGANGNFSRLLRDGYLNADNPSGLLARVTAHEPAQRMPPPPAEGWSTADIRRLQRFVKQLFAQTGLGEPASDEGFPAELLQPYSGPAAQGGPDNTFLTYHQLRGKIRTLFGEEWERAGEEQFALHVAQFNGADFVERFDESSKASPTFLSALDTLARDVSARALLNRTGPFSGAPAKLPALTGASQPDAASRGLIGRLYRSLLFRDPRPEETADAYRMLQAVRAEAPRTKAAGGALDFELLVRDEAGREARKSFRIPYLPPGEGFYQEWIDQSPRPETPRVRAELARRFALQPGSGSQRLLLTNEATQGNVSLAAVELVGPLPQEKVRAVPVTDPSVEVTGSWDRDSKAGFTSLEDGDQNKGSSSVTVPLAVDEPGEYRIGLVWRRPGQKKLRGAEIEQPGAPAVPVQIFAGIGRTTAGEPLPPVPPPGEAHFFVDQTEARVKYRRLEPRFRFGPSGGVEINNLGTQRRVTADSILLTPGDGSEPLIIDDVDAEGGWPKLVTPTRFKPFNQVGEGSVSDNGNKAAMRLLYRPARAGGWQAEQLYQVGVGFPGLADNESRTPVIVRAEESTPIIQMSRPLVAGIGAEVILDASATYNLQRTPLKYTWIQTGGPAVGMSDPNAARVSFKVEPFTADQAAWQALCQALLKHPDFLFTRPPSLAVARDAAERRRLQLVKIAQDLVARPPNAAELAALDQGRPLAELVEAYLAGDEFKDHYFRRVRLLLESRGTPVEDEPARLWSYIAFNDRPMAEILTADYTVDSKFQRRPRPEYHGRTGLLTMKGFIRGKPGLPHFNYAALVTEKFLGYVYEVPPSIIQMREGITAVSTTSPSSACYSCHKILTPLAYQRLAWNDDGEYVPAPNGTAVDDSDRDLVASYPYQGKGMEAFALQAVRKERFIRTMIQTHFVQFFGREMRADADERGLYRKLWTASEREGLTVRGLLRQLMSSPEYLDGRPAAPEGVSKK